MFPEQIFIIIGVVSGVVGAIYGVKAYYRKLPQYAHDQQKHGPETVIMNGSKQTIYEREAEGEFTSLTLDVRCMNLISTSQIFIHYLLDDRQPITYSLRELVDAGYAQELPPSANVTKVMVNLYKVYPFHKRGQVILENQTNQGFNYSSAVEAKYVKKR